MGTARKDQLPGDDNPQPPPGNDSADSRTHQARASAERGDRARAARIRALKQQIADGTYKPDPHEIAREIIKRGL